jgi:hypothetical protein
MNKELRDWLEFALSVIAALAAAYVFFRYDSKQKVIDEKLGALNAQIAEVTGRRAKIELAALESDKLRVTKLVRSVPIREGDLRQLDFQFRLENAGTLPTEINTATVEVYTGLITGRIIDGAALNAPTEAGPVKWTSVLRRANIAESLWKTGGCVNSNDPSAKPRCIRAGLRGGSTGVLTAGQTSQTGVLMLVSAKADLVACYLTLGVGKRGRQIGIIDRPDVPPGNVRQESDGRNG